MWITVKDDHLLCDMSGSPDGAISPRVLEPS